MSGKNQVVVGIILVVVLAGLVAGNFLLFGKDFSAKAAPPPVNPVENAPAKPSTPAATTNSVASSPPAVASVESKPIQKFAKLNASSVLKEKSGTMHPVENMVDGNPETAWSEGFKGSGVNQWVQVSFDKPQIIDKVGIIPGYNKTVDDQWGNRFYRNERVKGVVLSWDGGAKNFTFQDKPEMQYIDLLSVKTDFLRLTIKSVYPGSNWDDTCISELEVIGRPFTELDFAKAAKKEENNLTPPAWVITAGAFPTKEGAMKKADSLKALGFNASMLYIPDYSSLSGAKMWLAYVGPVDYPDRSGTKNLLAKVKSKVPDAYAIKVSNDGQRETMK